MDIRLHRTQWQLQHLGDFLIAMALDVAQQDAGPVLGPEPGDRLIDLAAELARGEPSSDRVSSSRRRR
jgi:hypothetical protein